MIRGFGTLAGLAIAMSFAASVAFAQSASLFGHSHHHAAPAPLLAAGIPAFAALGGGVLFNRVVRRFKRRD